MASAALYTPEVLALATGLAEWRYDPALPLHGEARSPTCGSTISIALELTEAGAIGRIGLRAHACAIGQAAAAIFAGAAPGRDRTAIHSATAAIERWLSEGGDLPDWPGLAAIAAARGYPARHGAILLAWRAALAALPSTQNPG